MKAVKENREYTLTSDEEVKVYKERGFDIYNDDGTLKEYGAGKTVSIEQYDQLKAENAKLTAEVKKLRKDLKAAEKSDNGEKEPEDDKKEQ